MSLKTTLERAFEIAREGHCASVMEIEKQLRAEGYTEWAALLGRGRPSPTTR